MKDFEEFKKQVLSELDKIKDVEDEVVKAVYSTVTELFNKGEEAKEEAKKEDKKDDAVEEKTEESKDKKEESDKAEDKKEPEAKEEKSDEKVDDKKEEPKAEPKEAEEKKEAPKEDVQLSREISVKLQEAALELDNQQKNIKAKDEVIAIKEAKIVELESSLKKYKDAELLELSKKLDSKVSNLIELYKSLGIVKEAINLKAAFNEEQIDKLIIDLSAMVPKVNEVVKPKRQTSVSSEIELNVSKQKNKKLNDDEIVNALFFG